MNDQLTWTILLGAVAAVSALLGAWITRMNYQELLYEQRESFKKRAAAYAARERSRLDDANRALIKARKELADARSALNQSALKSTGLPGLYVYDDASTEAPIPTTDDMRESGLPHWSDPHGHLAGVGSVDLKGRCIDGSDHLALAAAAATAASADLRSKRAARAAHSYAEPRRAA